ncbi:phage major capsid protein [Nesterenkonia sp. K-15-9-6]|uniref:phage major capsid protein n=1 Tax=Nesterenkonia sp. K-15-9-6 TaxID=3093918 RepID=UPI004043AC04
MNAVLSNVLESAGFRTATTRDRKVLEAARLFAEGYSGRSHTATALLKEAFTTSDFPALLGEAFEREARAAYREVSDETAPIARRESVVDFRPKRLVDVFGETYFEEVGEGEEYKSDNPLRDTEIEFQVSKWGRNYGLTWERWLNGDFSNLADFPGILGRGAANTRNRLVYRNLVSEDGTLNDGYFSETSTAALGFQSLKDAKQHAIEADNVRGDGPIDASTLVLVVPPSLEETARALTESRRVTETFDDGGTIREIERTNTLAGIQVQASHEFSRLLDTGIRHTAWALVPGAVTQNPALILASLAGHPEVDIRTKRDQGERVGGGQVGYQEGSFDNDTIWYRGRSVIGSAAAFTEGTYASTGAA